MNTRSTLHKQLQCNNENSYSTSITRKRLLSLVNYDILLLAVNLKKKGGIDDSNYGRSTYSGGRSTHSPDNAVYRQEIYQPRQVRGRHGGRSLACQARSFEEVCGKPNKAGNRRQKIKPVADWLWTTNKFMAGKASLRERGKLTRDGPRNALPMLSIAKLAKNCQRLYKRWDCNRNRCFMRIQIIKVFYLTEKAGSEAS